MIDYLRQAAGFFLQYFPCTMLCMLPFSQESVRLRKRTVYVAMTLGSAALSLLFLLFLGSGTHDLYMLLAVLLFSVAYFALIREPPFKKMLVLYLVIFYAASQYWLVNTLLPLLHIETVAQEVYSARSMILWVATTAILFPLAIWVFRRIVADYIRAIDASNIRRQSRLVMLSTPGFFLLIIYYNSVTDYISPKFWRLYGPPILLMLLDQCLIYWLLLSESMRRKRDSEHQKALEIQKLQYETITREIENDRRLRHDMRHWLNGLNDLLQQDKLDEMRVYLAQVIAQTARRESRTYCRNPVVNGLLQYYVGLAQSDGIRCEVHAVCAELSLSPTDLTVIFGNAMENAIHACRELDGERWIAIRIGAIGDSLMVQIQNPCRGVHLSSRDGGFLPASAFVSTRPGGGIGLRSMEHTAKKYGGHARFCFDETDKTFTARIRLNLYPETL